MKLLYFRLGRFDIGVYTIMGMQVGIELDDEHYWVSISLLLIKITITMEPSFDPFAF